MKNCNEDKKSPYLMYWDGSNLYGRDMFKKLPVDGFKWKSQKFKNPVCHNVF